jgi:hypothetical protein
MVSNETVAITVRGNAKKLLMLIVANRACARESPLSILSHGNQSHVRENVIGNVSVHEHDDSSSGGMIALAVASVQDSFRTVKEIEKS